MSGDIHSSDMCLEMSRIKEKKKQEERVQL